MTGDVAAGDAASLEQIRHRPCMCYHPHDSVLPVYHFFLTITFTFVLCVSAFALALTLRKRLYFKWLLWWLSYQLFICRAFVNHVINCNLFWKSIQIFKNNLGCEAIGTLCLNYSFIVCSSIIWSTSNFCFKFIKIFLLLIINVSCVHRSCNQLKNFSSNWWKYLKRIFFRIIYFV